MERKIERFDKYMKYKGLNDNKVTNSLGLSIGTLGKSRKENRDLSDRNIENILKFYTDLNRTWLLTGEGDMLDTSCNSIEDSQFSSSSDLHLIPLLPVSAQGGSLNDFVVSIKESSCEKIISPIKGADYAMSVSGESMAPEYLSGSQILIKRIDEKAFIDWGRVYVLDTCNGTVIKRLFPSETADKVLCKSINPEFPPFEVSLSDVYAVYRVLMCMALK
ncbi:S24 family peptidase [Prevotella melaninogenica]|uniref:S24 family peptidase n=1 Tax=Prevotella melaninogenica TaxID=28132 RepID=UPI00215164E4|nr:S24 family peptidase [Prevotella melaninogenica]